MDKKKSKKIIFWIIILGFCFIVLISLIYGFVNWEEEPEFSFNSCIEKYIFVYEDLCGNKSFYITYPEMKTIKGKLPILRLNDYPYNVYTKRCIKNFEIGCGEYHGKI